MKPQCQNRWGGWKGVLRRPFCNVHADFLQCSHQCSAVFTPMLCNVHTGPLQHSHWSSAVFTLILCCVHTDLLQCSTWSDQVDVDRHIYSLYLFTHSCLTCGKSSSHSGGDRRRVLEPFCSHFRQLTGRALIGHWDQVCTHSGSSSQPW